MKLKTSVAISLGVSLGLMTLVLLAGLLLPTSVLTKFSKDKSSTTTPASKVADTSDTKAVDKAATQQTTEAQQTTTEQPAAAQPTATGAKPTTTTTTTTTTTGTTTSGGTTSGGGTTAPTTIAPTLTFSGSPTTITSGASSVLSWSINTNATAPVTCTATGGTFAGSKATSGSQSVSPTSTTTYTLTCTNTKGSSGAKTVTITVNPAGPACGSAGGACTSAQVAAHNTSGDCWVIYNTNYLILSGSGVVGSNGNEVTNHSGGSSRITPYCGGNATSAFTSKHGGQTSVKNIFNSYIVGPVQ